MSGEDGPSALRVTSERTMTPALSSGLRHGEGAAETRGIEERVDENQDGRRVADYIRMAVGAGDIPGPTDMGSILGRSSLERAEG